MQVSAPPCYIRLIRVNCSHRLISIMTVVFTIVSTPRADLGENIAAAAKTCWETNCAAYFVSTLIRCWTLQSIYEICFVAWCNAGVGMRLRMCRSSICVRRKLYDVAQFI
jgi:hypothetical protein